MNRCFRLLLAMASTVSLLVACGNDEVDDTKQPEPQPQAPAAERFEVFPLLNPADIPYRIPALACTKDGVLVAVADYRHSGTDIGVTDKGRIDLHYRLSYDNGNTWTEIMTLIEGKGAQSPDFMNVGYGDPCIVADRESSRVLVMSCAGNVSFHNGTRHNHQNIARFYSEDCGKTWSEPEDIAESIYSQFDNSAYGPVRSMFVASGRIMQSRITKVGEYYRLYCSMWTRDGGNRVIYSDDFGGSWNVLGKISDRPAPGGDEPKCEELPDGTVVLSSRKGSGRYFNLFTFTDNTYTTGKWGTAVASNDVAGGLAFGGNSTNGEIYKVKAVRKSDKQECDLMFQSIPTGNDRSNVAIYYKEMEYKTDGTNKYTPTTFSQGWTKGKHVSTKGSCYSTMILQADGRIAFLFEEEPGGYCIIYIPYTIEEITGGAYTIDTEATGIDPIHLSTEHAQPSAIYDLLGRRTAKAHEGIYIVDGKKVIY